MEPTRFGPRSVAFLLRLQEELFGPLTRSHESSDAEARRIVLAALPETDRAIVAAAPIPDDPVPTQYESPENYSILTDVAGQILAALAEDATLPDPPLVGTLPVGWPTAILLRVPHSTDHLVVVDVQFTVFANLLAKACAQGLMSDPDDLSKEAWTRGLENPTHPGVQRYVELMTATLHEGPAGAPAYWPDAEWSGVASQLRTAIEVFVMAAPFAHLAMGHTEGAPVLSMSALHPTAESYDWDESHRAGAFLLQVAVAASVFDRQGFDKSLGYWAIDIFLRSIVLIEVLQAEARGVEAPSGTSGQEALALLRPVLVQAEGAESRSSAMLDRLSPIADAFLRQAALGIGGQAGGVH